MREGFGGTQHGGSKMRKDKTETSKESTEHVVSAARRRALKVGLALSPVILTLRSKPVFGVDNCGASMSLSAAQSHHVVDVLPRMQSE